jgi:hypothetical protein
MWYMFPMPEDGSFQIFLPLLPLRKLSPQHYPKNCPFHHIDSPPYHSEEDNDEEEEDDIPDQLCDDEFDDDLGGNGAWGNILGEPIDD